MSVEASPQIVGGTDPHLVEAIEEHYRQEVKLLMHTLFSKLAGGSNAETAEIEAKRGFVLLGETRAAMLRVIVKD